MKLAIDNGLLRVSNCANWFNDIKALGFKYDKKTRELVGDCTLDRLNGLAAIGRLPDAIEGERRRQAAVYAEIEAEKQEQDPHPFVKYPVSVPLYKHQIKAANCAMRLFFANIAPQHRGFAYLMEMGTGKSLTAIAVAGALYKYHQVKRLLIVCPSSLCFVWADELAKFAKFPYRAAVMQGDKKHRLAALARLQDGFDGAKDELRVAIINYESTFCDGIDRALEEFDADMIICDEAQRIKSAQAAQSKEMHHLGAAARFKLILTGTPIQNKVIDVFSEYKFLDSSVFGGNFYAFRNRYVQMGGYQQHEVVGYRNVDELTRKMHAIAFRVRKEECLDLPAQTFETHTLEFEPSTKKLYNRLAKDSIAELEQGEITAATVVTKLLRLRQLTGGFVRADGEDKPRLENRTKQEALYDIIESVVLEGGKKLVVFACFKAEIAAICELLGALRVGHVVIEGDVPQSERGRLVNAFQTDDSVKVFVGQLQTTGVGLTLTAASTAVFYSQDFNYANYTQALARIHRIGQTEKVTYITLAVRGTVDEKIQADLERKGVTAEQFVDKWREYFAEIKA